MVEEGGVIPDHFEFSGEELGTQEEGVPPASKVHNKGTLLFAGRLTVPGVLLAFKVILGSMEEELKGVHLVSVPTVIHALKFGEVGLKSKCDSLDCPGPRLSSLKLHSTGTVESHAEVPLSTFHLTVIGPDWVCEELWNIVSMRVE